MGFDLYGVKPAGPALKEKGEVKGSYFRSNCWWWRRLWDFVCTVCADFITEDEHQRGHFNDGYLIDARRATKIYARLIHLLDQGEVKRFEVMYKTFLDILPMKECWLCKGTGTRTDMVVKDGCNSCHGTGEVKDDMCSYPFSEEHVREFAEFCRHSGGFTIN